MNTKKLHFSKELSWLSFNERVLQEAADTRNPIVERVHFLGIFSNNQDEFFKVRVAGVRRAAREEERSGNPGEASRMLAQIHDRIVELTEKFDVIYHDVLKQLKSKKVFFISDEKLSDKQSKWLDKHFRDHILQHVVPIWVTDTIMLDKLLDDDVSYLAVQLKKGKLRRYAILDIPERVPRFINIPPDRGHARNYFMVMDEVIRHCLDKIFNPFVDYDSVAAWSMKFSRDSVYELYDDLDLSLMEKLSLGMKQRLTAEPVRLSYDKTMPSEMVSLLRERLGIENIDSVIPGGRYRNFRDFISFSNPGNKWLENQPLRALECHAFDSHRNVFEALDAGDVLLCYPYHRFNYFTEFVRQAAFDPAVKDIRINIYRVAANSRVIESLIDASRNGKKVTVNIELLARFDEEHNLKLTEKLSNAEIKVTLGIPGLKVHSKLCVVTRESPAGDKRYAVLGTGNFNESTARIYTDFSLFTANQEICNEAASIFQFIETSYRQPRLNHLLVSPINTRTEVERLIQREIDHARSGGSGLIKVKLNNLVDESIAALLYTASQAGVQVKLIVRGMCSIRPGIKGVSDNISITSIVDRFLEHTRMMIFDNMGDPDIYISSADWMTRNLDERVEVSCPIYDPAIKKLLIDIMDIQLADNQKARIIDSEQKNAYVPRGNRRKVRSQEAIHDYLSAREQAKE
ncbi:MAG: polyphosphate kinase [Gammaproteobacteria bacterium BRH_c0]|nr:MAG: polyphosphate kinase [Gammaproteobacteria bacterium BRH_c0]